MTLPGIEPATFSGWACNTRTCQLSSGRIAYNRSGHGSFEEGSLNPRGCHFAFPHPESEFKRPKPGRAESRGAMGDGPWAMGDGRWAMGDARWAMGAGRLCFIVVQHQYWNCLLSSGGWIVLHRSTTPVLEMPPFGCWLDCASA